MKLTVLTLKGKCLFFLTEEITLCQRNVSFADKVIFATAVSLRYSEIISCRFRMVRNFVCCNLLIISSGIFFRQ